MLRLTGSSGFMQKLFLMSFSGWLRVSGFSWWLRVSACSTKESGYSDASSLSGFLFHRDPFRIILGGASCLKRPHQEIRFLKC